MMEEEFDVLIPLGPVTRWEMTWEDINAWANQVIRQPVADEYEFRYFRRPDGEPIE